ncbi:MAG: nucleotidyl transferase AbiEii/AbiGii toxin family protein [Propionibacteriaceae bacterium]|nr:nucleotidyl transferase AbiEii/AbiGii toxin family protein [Propionibacteriaceae bacterium]
MHEWAVTHPWSSPSQVEQDLLLTRAICEIAAHPYLGRELIFRGGTALHKLHLDKPFRYSEDLDYVRSTAGGIGPLVDALRDVGTALGFQTASLIREHPKVVWKTTTDDGLPLKIKIEINTHERSPELPVIALPFQVESRWWTGQVRVRTFQPPELVATKIRALYQRCKGRDLFDLWLALTKLGLDPENIITAFTPYRPEGLTASLTIANLEEKLANPKFRVDLDQLVTDMPTDYDIDQAADLVIQRLLRHLDD